MAYSGVTDVTDEHIWDLDGRITGQERTTQPARVLPLVLSVIIISIICKDVQNNIIYTDVGKAAV